MTLPNKLTLGRMVAVIAFVILYLKEYWIISTIIFILACITDFLDGRIARKYNLITNFGKIMDPLADKILVYSAFCLFIQDGKIPAWTLIIILLREFLVSGVRTVAASNGTVIAADWAGKVKTILQMIAVPALILSVYSTLIYWFAYIVFYASLVMTVYSGANYTIKNSSVFKS